MAEFVAEVVSKVPCQFTAKRVAVQADSQAEAEAKIISMHNADKIDYDFADGEKYYDEAKIESITFEEE